MHFIVDVVVVVFAALKLISVREFRYSAFQERKDEGSKPEIK